MRPVIGVSCYGERAAWGVWDVDAVVLHRAYITAIEESGGADVDPASYGDDPHETTDRPRLDRDATERRLYRGARDRGLPVLGICRGMQVMAVEAGGRLLQDLPSAGYGLAHRERPGTFTEHGATFVEGSLASRILGTTGTVVNSSHHQSVADPGSLTVTGHASDGTLETLEDPDAAFVLGVQWHPEMTEDRRLFEALAVAARHHAHTRV